VFVVAIAQKRDFMGYNLESVLTWENYRLRDVVGNVVGKNEGK
jgi:hypothetical protein